MLKIKLAEAGDFGIRWNVLRRTDRGSSRGMELTVSQPLCKRTGGEGQFRPHHRDPRLESLSLRMMFVCCHPMVPPEAQVALALKTLCGFSVTEISRAFLTTDAAIAKRLTRAKQKIREAKIPFGW